MTASVDRGARARRRPWRATESTYARRASGLLRQFNEAGVLGLADVHTADRVGRICDEPDERVLLALALTVRALRLGSVCLDLATAAQTMFDEGEESIDTSGLPWPDPDAWTRASEASAMVTRRTGRAR